MRPRPLDRFTPDQDTTLWLVVAVAVCLIAGILFRAWLAERRRDREGARDPPRADSPGS